MIDDLEEEREEIRRRGPASAAQTRITRSVAHQGLGMSCRSVAPLVSMTFVS